jgi:hypothetical protein
MGMSTLVVETTEGARAAAATAFMGLPITHSLALDDLARLPDDGRRYEIIDGSLIVSPAPAFLTKTIAYGCSTSTHFAKKSHPVSPWSED